MFPGVHIDNEAITGFSVVHGRFIAFAAQGRLAFHFQEFPGFYPVEHKRSSF
jgi:hypothetical protein